MLARRLRIDIGRIPRSSHLHPQFSDNYIDRIKAKAGRSKMEYVNR